LPAKQVPPWRDLASDCRFNIAHWLDLPLFISHAEAQASRAQHGMAVEIRARFGLTNFIKKIKFAFSWLSVAKTESSEIFEI